MSEPTNYLGLLKKDSEVDRDQLFSLKEILNDNWDKIDEKCEEFVNQISRNSSKNHEHVNRSTLDTIKSEDVNSWNKSFNITNYGYKIAKNESFTISENEANAVINIGGNQAITITVPKDDSIPRGCQIFIFVLTGQAVTFVPGEGSTIYSKDNNRKVDGQYTSVSLIKDGDESWFLFGSLIS